MLAGRMWGCGEERNPWWFRFLAEVTGGGWWRGAKRERTVRDLEFQSGHVWFKIPA